MMLDRFRNMLKSLFTATRGSQSTPHDSRPSAPLDPERLKRMVRDTINPSTESGQVRYALWKNPENLNAHQQAKLALIAQTNKPLYKAYLLKEQFRQVFKLKGERGKGLLEAWLQWARRCRLRPFLTLAKAITKNRPGIEATLDLGLSNALVESVNTRIRLLGRQAFGFHSPEPLIALAMLALGGLCPPLPGRAS